MSINFFRKAVKTVIVIVFVMYSKSGFSQEEIQITIGSDTMQNFKGIGFNMTHYQPWVDNLASNEQEDYIYSLVNNWGISSIQLWGDKWGTPCCGSTKDPRFAVDTTQFGIRENVLQAVQWFQEAGIGNILMMPTRDRHEAHHVDFWTNCAMMWKNKGVNITALSFLNKPNTGHGFQDSGTSRRSPDSITSGVKALRLALDDKGFDDMKIYGPSVIEWHPPQFADFGDSYDFEYGDTATYLNSLMGDEDAVAAIDAIDMQSYGRGLTNWEYGLARDNDKELWVSLSATDGLNNNMNDPILGPITAGNILSNLNHGVSLWHHWLLSDLTNSDGSFKQRMFYLVNISTIIDPGAKMRSCTSDHPDLPSPDMRWNYNLKEDGTVTDWQPDIISAAGQNSDGSWFIGVVNLSGIYSQHKASVYDGIQKTYKVRITAEELAGYRVLFDVTKCKDSGGIQPAGVDTMYDGIMELTIDSKDLLVLKSTEKSDITGLNDYQSLSEMLDVYPNPAYDIVTISLPGYVGWFRISIYDLTGKQVFASDIWNGEQLRVEHMPAGVYLINLEDENNIIFRKKLVIQRRY